MTRHLTRAELQAGLPHIRESPKDDGVLEAIVVRPASVWTWKAARSAWRAGKQTRSNES